MALVSLGNELQMRTDGIKSPWATQYVACWTQRLRCTCVSELGHEADCTGGSKGTESLGRREHKTAAQSEVACPHRERPGRQLTYRAARALNSTGVDSERAEAFFLSAANCTGPLDLSGCLLLRIYSLLYMLTAGRPDVCAIPSCSCSKEWKWR